MFLKIAKLYNGKLENIIVPGGISIWGWRKMVECLDNLVGKRFWSLNRGSGLGSYHGAKWKAPERTFFNSGQKFIPHTRRNQGDEGEPSDKAIGTSYTKKDWRRVVIVVRFSTSQPWGHIHLGLSNMFKLQHGINPLAADRAIVWTGSDEEKRRMEKMDLCTIPEAGKVRIQRWNPESQLKNSKIECKSN